MSYRHVDTGQVITDDNYFGLPMKKRTNFRETDKKPTHKVESDNDGLLWTLLMMSAMDDGPNYHGADSLDGSYSNDFGGGDGGGGGASGDFDSGSSDSGDSGSSDSGGSDGGGSDGGGGGD